MMAIDFREREYGAACTDVINFNLGTRFANGLSL